MTGTHRATGKAALLKDHSVSKSGRDSSMQKHGSGPHNWGSVEDEIRASMNGQYDEADIEEDEADDVVPSAINGKAPTESNGTESATANGNGFPIESKSANGNTNENGNGTVNGNGNGAPPQPRRQSSVDEDREKAKAFRTRAASRGELDLVGIARSSAALSHSPPTSTGGLSTSPVANVSALANKLGKY